MEDREFTIHLFSNSSLANYPDNSLTRFQVDLSSPLYLGSSYSVALSEIYVPPAFPAANSLSARDCIIYEDMNYVKFHGDKNDFAAFIETTMRLCSMDVTLYDRAYFRDYLDPNIIYHPDTLRETHPNDVTTIASDDRKRFFNLDIDKLFSGKVGSVPSEMAADYYPIVKSSDFKRYFDASSVTVVERRRYTLKQLLWTCINKILSKTRMETYATAGTANPSYGELLGQLPKRDSFEKEIIKVVTNSGELIRRFIERFIESVQTVRLAMMKERSLKPIRLEKFLIVYCDICADRLFSSTRARILSVFDYSARRDFSIKLSQLDYNKIDRPIVHSISILLMDEHGEQLDLQPSAVPTHVCLKIKRR